MKANGIVKNRGEKKSMYMRFQYFLKIESRSRLRKPQPRTSCCVWATEEKCTTLCHAAHPREAVKSGLADLMRSVRNGDSLQIGIQKNSPIDFLPGIVKYSLAFTHKHKQTNKTNNKTC